MDCTGGVSLGSCIGKGETSSRRQAKEIARARSIQIPALSLIMLSVIFNRLLLQISLLIWPNWLRLMKQLNGLGECYFYFYYLLQVTRTLEWGEEILFNGIVSESNLKKVPKNGAVECSNRVGWFRDVRICF
jgi:hypothetical protein